MVIKFNYFKIGKHHIETRCTIFDDDKPPIIGKTKCSKNDQFIKSVGRKKALTNALIFVPRMQRKAIWAEYWSKHKS